jgi:excisionase family DNA binding protein
VDIIREQKHKVPEAAKFLGKSPKTVWTMVADGRIGVYRVGKSVLIGESEIRRILEEGFTPARRTA